MKYLHVLIGLPRSGKTTYIENCLPCYPRIESDVIRRELYNERYIHEREAEVLDLMCLMARSLFSSGHDNVIIDDSHQTAKDVYRWNIEGVQTIFHVIPTDKEACLTRAKERNQTELLPVIEKTYTRLKGVNFIKESNQ